jgi:hypothetical protein
VGGITLGMLMNLSKGGRIGLPGVTRIAGWLGRPATTFTRVVPRRRLTVGVDAAMARGRRGWLAEG